MNSLTLRRAPAWRLAGLPRLTGGALRALWPTLLLLPACYSISQ